MRPTTPRLTLLALALPIALAAAVTVPPQAAYADDDPLICVETGEVYVGPIVYDPPDPCVL